ncbi:MAG: hypothetical protein K2Y32_20050 [Candidatus Obscuribacterales bacterium]|nr:hypothetical protein [Candidatus Obscuribacterales bacterium]
MSHFCALSFSRPLVLLCSLLTALLSPFPAIASYDHYLYGEREPITVWSDVRSDWGEGTIKDSEMLHVYVDALTMLYLSPSNKSLSQLQTELELYLPDNKSFKEELFLNQLQFAGTRKVNILRAYLRLFHLPEELDKSRPLDFEVFFLRRLLSLVALGKVKQAGYLASALVEVGKSNKAFFTIHPLTERLLSRLSAGSLKTSDHLQISDQKFVNDSLSKQEQEVELVDLKSYDKSILGALTYLDSGDDKEKLGQALSLYEDTYPDRHFYALACLQKLIRLTADQPEMHSQYLEKAFNSLHFTDKWLRPITNELRRQYLEEQWRELYSLDLPECGSNIQGSVPKDSVSEDWDPKDWDPKDYKDSKLCQKEPKLERAYAARLSIAKDDISKDYAARELSENEKIKLGLILHRLASIAYIDKIDGRAEESGRLYRLCFLLAERYLGDNTSIQTMLLYDMAENAMWSEYFDEASFYFSRCLDLRRRANSEPDSSIVYDTDEVLGRTYIAAWNTAAARAHYLQTVENLSGAKVLLNEHNEVDEKSLSIAFDLLKAKYRESGETRKKLILNALQGLADACVNGKYYDTALAVDQFMLDLRLNLSDKVEESQIQALYWQMAWGQQNAMHHEAAAHYYSKMIERYPEDPANVQAMWYQSRAMCNDLSGRFAQAESDFRQALKYFRLAYKSEKVATTRDTYLWSIWDIKYNLSTRNLLRTPHYNDHVYSCFFKREKLPLRVFLPDNRRNGFGGKLRSMMLQAVSEWTDFANSPIKVVYVDKAEDADIFVERVTSYTDIPYGSAGRSSAVYGKKKGEDTRELKKIHIRVFCQSYDGSDKELSNYARIHLYTLFIHEFGHGLGLPHSPNGLDVMYWKACALKPSERDKETIRSIYSADAL